VSLIKKEQTIYDRVMAYNKKNKLINVNTKVKLLGNKNKQEEMQKQLEYEAKSRQSVLLMAGREEVNTKRLYTYSKMYRVFHMWKMLARLSKMKRHKRNSL